MASSLVQPFIDKENTVNVTSGKNRLASTSNRHVLGKTFGGNTSSLVTPRKALGNVNNDQGLRTALGNVTNTAKKIQPTQLKKPGLQSKTPAPHKSSLRLPSFNTPSLQGQSVRRKTKTNVTVSKSVCKKTVTDFPDVEYMPAYKEDTDDGFDVWGEYGRPSTSLIFSKSCRMIPRMRLHEEKPEESPDLSMLRIEPVDLLKKEFDDISDDLFSMEDFAKGIEFKDLDPVELPDLANLIV